jgi:hypothetical protein
MQAVRRVAWARAGGREMKTIQQLMKWAKGKAYYSVTVDGGARVEMKHDHFNTVYDGDTLYEALQEAYRQEQSKKQETTK